jgi:hypothetical protein
MVMTFDAMNNLRVEDITPGHWLICGTNERYTTAGPYDGQPATGIAFYDKDGAPLVSVSILDTFETESNDHDAKYNLKITLRQLIVDIARDNFSGNLSKDESEMHKQFFKKANDLLAVTVKTGVGTI